MPRARAKAPKHQQVPLLIFRSFFPVSLASAAKIEALMGQMISIGIKTSGKGHLLLGPGLGVCTALDSLQSTLGRNSRNSFTCARLRASMVQGFGSSAPQKLLQWVLRECDWPVVTLSGPRNEQEFEPRAGQGSPTL